MTLSARQDIATFAPAVLDALRCAGVSARLRTSHSDLWAQTCARLEYFPVDYSSAIIDYQLAYWSGNGRPAIDVSVILEYDNRPCAVWPLSILDDGERGGCICSNGGPIIPPLFVAGIARKSIKTMIGACIEAVRHLCQVLGQSTFESAEAYVGEPGMSEWHDQLMFCGANSALHHDLFVDLSPSIEEIKSRFRRRYKSFVNAGNKLWNVEVIRQEDSSQWEEFHQLHIAVAGRVTRSEESWRIQHEAVASGDAFFVRLRDVSRRMVGAGLFYLTRDEGLYAVGAYDRALFDKPLGHVVQYRAIEEMKRRGVRWYKLGIRSYPADLPAPSEKEITISNFKQGFSSHIFPRYSLTCARR